MNEPKKLGPGERSGGHPNEPIIAVYYCQTPGCGNYYGSSTMVNLEIEAVEAPVTSKDAGQIRFMRSRCPDCHQNRVRRYARLISLEEVNEIKKRIQTEGKK